MEVGFTLWKNIKAQCGTLLLQDWAKWVVQLSKTREVTAPKTSLPCLVPAVFVENAARKNANIVQITGLALDIEKANAKGFENDLEAYNKRLEAVITSLDYEYMCWTTYSHSEEDPRYRILFPLAKPITVKQFPAAMAYLNTLTGSIADRGAQRASQPHILPFHPPSSKEAWSIHNEGPFLDVTTDLAKEVVDIRGSLGEANGRASHSAAVRVSCYDVLNGKAFAKEGGRDTAALHIAWHLCNRHAKVSLEAVETVFKWSLDAMGEGAPTAENIWDKIRRGREKVVAAQVETGEEGNPTNDPYMVQFQGRYTFLKPGGGYTCSKPKEDVEMAIETYLSKFEGIELFYTTKAGDKRQRKINDLMKQYGVLAEEAVIDLDAKRSYFKDGVFHESTVKWPNLEARFDPLINEWFHVLAKERYESFLDWLALFGDLKRVLSTLVIMGAPRSGKTLLAMGLARRFGSQAPATQDALTGKFQEELARCPLIHIDEEITDSYAEKTFLAAIRAQLSVRERSVNRKYLAPVQMLGAIRCIITSNHLPFKQKESSTGQDLAAIAERFYWMQADKEAAQFLDGVEHKVKEHWKQRGIAEHVMHLEETRRVSHEHRFGVSGDSQKLAELINIGVRWNSWVTEWVCNGAIERFKTLGKEDPDTAYGAIIVNGRIYVRVKAIVKAWERYLPNIKAAPDTRPISDALKGISERHGVKPKDLGIDGINNQYRYYEIRNGPLVTWLEHIGSGSRQELEHALSTDTKIESRDGGNVIPLTQ